MATMNVSLPAEMISFVEAEVAAGDYASASEVVRDALRLLRRERATEQERIAILRREIERGVADADSGHLTRISAAEIAEQVAAQHRK